MSTEERKIPMQGVDKLFTGRSECDRFPKPTGNTNYTPMETLKLALTRVGIENRVERTAPPQGAPIFLASLTERYYKCLKNLDWPYLKDKRLLQKRVQLLIANSYIKDLRSIILPIRIKIRAETKHHGMHIPLSDSPLAGNYDRFRRNLILSPPRPVNDTQENSSRPSINYRRLNTSAVSGHYPVHDLQETIINVGKARYFLC